MRHLADFRERCPRPRRPLLGLALLALWPALDGLAQTGDQLPARPTSRGEIRRGPDGELIVVPFASEAGAAPAPAAPEPAAAGRVLRVGPGEAIATVTDAARQARNGDVIEIQPGEYRHQPAVWTQDRLTIRGSGARPVMRADGASAEGKAIWVVRGGRISIENVEFRGARVADGNGAGIRFERGDLSVRNCVFMDNEMGILTANAPELSLSVEDSVFGQAPKHAGLLHHLLYVGAIGKFTLVGSRFEQGFKGHLVKSRARESHILYNRLVDGPQGQASYELEFPNGGIAYVIGNVIGQSETTDNQAIVAYGAEGQRWPDNALYLSHNTLVNDSPNGTFLKVWNERLPAQTEVWAINNLTMGYGTFTSSGQGRFEGNQEVARTALVNDGGLPLRLTAQSPLRGSVRLPGSVHGVDLLPKAEFTAPVGTKAIPATATVSPGAFQ